MAYMNTFLSSFLLALPAYLFCVIPLSYSAALCNGPKTPDELAESLWGNSSNNTKMKFTRPTVALLASEGSDLYPFSSAAPDNVSVNVHIQTIKDIEQRSSEFSVTLFMRKRWNDHRLRFNSKSDGGCFETKERVGFSKDQLEHIWTPDIVIQNLADEPLKVADSFWIHPNGDVEWTVSLLLTLSCNYDFQTFPRDTQVCEYVIGSWREDASELKLDFGDNPPLTKANKSNSVGDTLEWDVVDLSGVEVELWSDFSKDYESYLSFQFTLSRRPEYYVDFVIMPVILMVVLSWASFFIDRASAPARVTMSTICFLTITNFIANQLSSLPRLGMKDIWLLEFMEISLIFTFYSALEYVICNYLYRIERRVKETRKFAYRKKRRQMALQQNRYPKVNGVPKNIIINKNDMIDAGLCKLDRLILLNSGEMAFRDEHIEIFSRWIFPISYAMVLLVLSVNL